MDRYFENDFYTHVLRQCYQLSMVTGFQYPNICIINVMSLFQFDWIKSIPQTQIVELQLNS